MSNGGAPPPPKPAMRRSPRTHMPARIAPLLAASLKPNSPTTDPDTRLPDEPTRRPLRRRARKPTLSSWRNGGGGGGRRSGPNTPLLRWKFDDDDDAVDAAAGAPAEGVVPKGRPRKQRSAAACAAAAAPVSVRKLAAGIWQVQMPEASEVARMAHGESGFEPVRGHLQPPYLCNWKNAGAHKDPMDEISSPASVSSSKNAIISNKLEKFAALPNLAMERATKWDPGLSKASDEVLRFYGHLKLLEDQEVTAVSVVSSLRQELERARARIDELEDEQLSSKKKVDHFLKKFAEEKAAWRSREHEKIRAVINDLKDTLNKERKNRKWMEVLNSKLVNELKEAKLSAKQYLQDYEKERKARELMEEVCDELAKEIGEDKAEVEALRKDSMRIREEVEEERKMLQMAEVWREERVQMKLIDAKLMLEEKYMHIRNLQADLEAFLQGHSGTMPNSTDIREAQALHEAVKSIKAHELKEELVYHPPPPSEDIFSIFEEVQQQAAEMNSKEIEPCYGYSPSSPPSKIHTVSPEINGLYGNAMMKYANGNIDREDDAEDESGWETISPGEENGSSNSLDGSDPSVNGASGSGTEWEEHMDNNKLNGGTNEAYSAATKSKKKTSSISRLWRSSAGDNCKTATVDATKARLSNARLSNGTLSPDRGSGDVGLSPPSLGHWSSPDTMNAHMVRGMKGCIEWPRGAQKQSLKAELLEARMETQKVQLRQVLKQRI